MATSARTKPRATPDGARPLRDAADAVFRSAAECCRQHERLARVLELACSDAELSGVAEVVALCDKVLAKHTDAYELAAQAGRGREEEGWWHAANTLWLASREYRRRQAGCDDASAKLNRHTRAKLGELTLEYELEASAMLALQHAVQAYEKVRPGVA